MKKILFFAFYLVSSVLFAQKTLVSGPMLGYVEHREALVWLEVATDIKTVSIKFRQQGKPETTKTSVYNGSLNQAYNPIKIRLTELDMNTAYN